MAEVSGRIMRLARGVCRRLHLAQHGAKSRVAQRLSQRPVRPQCVHDRGRRVLLLPPQLLDQPIGLGPEGRGGAPRGVARLQRRRTVKSPEPDARVVPSGLQASDQT